jgi:hypothetical protein
MQTPTPERSTDEPHPERRVPRVGRLLTAAALVGLAIVVLWAAVTYGAQSDSAAAPAADSTTLAGNVPSTDATTTPTTTIPTKTSTSTSTTPATTTVPAPSAVSSAAGAASTGTSKGAAKKPTTKAAVTATTTAAAASPTPTFTPVVVQAEASANTLSGGASVTDCDTCDGGARVRYVGRVTVHLTASVAGSRAVTVAYEASGDRYLEMSVNGGAPVSARVTGTSWTTPHSYTFTVQIPAGSVNLAFYCDIGGGSAADLDKISIR